MSSAVASAARNSASAVFPMPASPTIVTSPGCPAAAAPQASRSTPISLSPPTSAVPPALVASALAMPALAMPALVAPALAMPAAGLRCAVPAAGLLSCSRRIARCSSRVWAPGRYRGRGRAAAGAPRKPRGPSLARPPQPRPTCTTGTPPRRADRRPWPLLRSPPPVAGPRSPAPPRPRSAAPGAATCVAAREPDRPSPRTARGRSRHPRTTALRALGRGQRHRDPGDQLPFGLIAEAGRRVQVHDDALGAGESVPRPATPDEIGAQRRAEPADQDRDVLLRRSRPLFGHRMSTIRSTGTRAGRSTASSLSSVRDFRLPICPSVSSMPSRTTLNVPARCSSTYAALTDPAGPDLPTCTSYRWPARRARDAEAMTSIGTAVTRPPPGSGGPGRTAGRTRAR